MNHYRSLWYGLMLVAVTLIAHRAQAVPFVNATVTSETTTTLTTTDTLVIEAIAAHVVNCDSNRWRTKKQLLAILIESAPGEVKSAFLLPSFLVPLMADEASTDTLAVALWQRNTLAFTLERPIQGKRAVIVGMDQIKGRSEEDLRRSFPSVAESLCLWLPGYDADQTHALVYGWDSAFGAHGYKILLARSGDQWHVLSMVMDWEMYME